MTELEKGAVAETVPAVGPKMDDLIVAYLNQLGVETEEQRKILEDLGCDNYQGYLYSKPLSAKLFARKFLSREKAI